MFTQEYCVSSEKLLSTQVLQRLELYSAQLKLATLFGLFFTDEEYPPTLNLFKPTHWKFFLKLSRIVNQLWASWPWEGREESSRYVLAGIAISSEIKVRSPGIRDGEVVACLIMHNVWLNFELCSLFCRQIHYVSRILSFRQKLRCSLHVYVFGNLSCARVLIGRTGFQFGRTDMIRRVGYQAKWPPSVLKDQSFKMGTHREVYQRYTWKETW